jgi:hypothetical protein
MYRCTHCGKAYEITRFRFGTGNVCFFAYDITEDKQSVLLEEDCVKNIKNLTVTEFSQKEACNYNRFMESRGK